MSDFFKWIWVHPGSLIVALSPALIFFFNLLFKDKITDSDQILDRFTVRFWCSFFLAALVAFLSLRGQYQDSIIEHQRTQNDSIRYANTIENQIKLLHPIFPLIISFNIILDTSYLKNSAWSNFLKRKAARTFMQAAKSSPGIVGISIGDSAKVYSESLRTTDTFHIIGKFLAPQEIHILVSKDSLFLNHVELNANANRENISYEVWYDPTQKYFGTTITAKIDNVSGGNNDLQSFENAKGYFLLFRLKNKQDLKTYHINDLSFQCGSEYSSIYKIPISENDVYSYPVIPFNKYYRVKL